VILLQVRKWWDNEQYSKIVDGCLPCVIFAGIVKLILPIICKLYSLATDGALAAGGDFIGMICLTTFTAGSGPENFSTPACSITINNDLLVEQDETFSLTASIQNSNGQSAQFSAGGDTASATIVDNDGMLIQLIVFTAATIIARCQLVKPDLLISAVGMRYKLIM